MATKNAEISRRILTAKESGMSVRDAIDLVLGAGTYAKLASDVYDEIRSRK